MKTYAICPISDRKINERITRINAILTVLILIIFGLTQNIFLMAYLTIDFLLRASEYSGYSPTGIASGFIVRYLNFKENAINAGPKLFAARIGLILSSLIVMAFLLSLDILTYIVAGIMILFSFLEGALGICVACKIYPHIYRFLYNKKFR